MNEERVVPSGGPFIERVFDLSQQFEADTKKGAPSCHCHIGFVIIKGGVQGIRGKGNVKYRETDFSTRRDNDNESRKQRRE